MALNKFDLIMIVLMMIFIAILFLGFNSIKKDSIDCISNPINYTMEKLGYYCSCWKP